VSNQGAPSTRDPRRISYVSGAMPVSRPDVHVRAVSSTHVGRVRSANEDACIVVDLDQGAASPSGTLGRFDVGDKGVLLAVSDGMGGAKDGEVASRISIEVLAKTMLESAGVVDGSSVLEHATRAAHQAVWDESSRLGQSGRSRMGATLTAGIVRGRSLSIAQVGDSRAYLLRQGKMTQLTTDQTMIQSLIDKGLMKPEDAETSPFRNILTQAMGHQEDVAITMSEIELRDRDCILICSDGLTNELTDDEIRDAILQSIRLDVAAKRLVDMANARGGRDNITVVLAGIGGTTLPPASVR
jgi:serine/threonine protein phosphatase PrpC